jgi:hypothetical protein
MARFIASLSFAAALPVVVANGPHKCTVQWEVPERGVASVSFPVSSCLIKCKPTYTDNHHDKTFANAFVLEQEGRVCKCNQADGTNLLKFIGSCEHEGAKQCWSDYRALRTDSYKREFEKETTSVVHNFHLYAERTFDYTKCEQDACPNGDCYEGSFPSVMQGRSADEMQLLADILKKVANGDAEDLKGDDQKIIDALSTDDIGQIMFSDILAGLGNDANGNPLELTVAVLREIYQAKLKGSGVSVDRLLKVAKLTHDDQIVDIDAFKRFVQPAC